MKLLRVNAQSVTDHVPFIRGYSHIVFHSIRGIHQDTVKNGTWPIPRLSHREQSGHSLMWTTFALFPECTRFPCWTQKRGFLSWYPTRWRRLAHNIGVFLCDRGTSEPPQTPEPRGDRYLCTPYGPSLPYYPAFIVQFHLQYISGK